MEWVAAEAEQGLAGWRSLVCGGAAERVQRFVTLLSSGVELALIRCDLWLVLDIGRF